jgi:hypothetical protein
MPRSFAVAALMVPALVAGLALIFVAWPGTMYGTMTPLDIVGEWMRAAMSGDAGALLVVGFAGAVAAAIVVATVWLSRNVVDERPV